MDPNKERAKRALDAVESLGFPKKEVKRVIKRLFKLFDRNWEPIEDDSYRVLIDAILDEQLPAASNEGTDEEPMPQPNGATGFRLEDQQTSASASRCDLSEDDNEIPLIKKRRRASTDYRHEQSLHPPAVEGRSVGVASPQPLMVLPRDADQHGRSLQNRQDAIILEGPKRGPEIDSPAGHVAKHLNLGTSGADARGSTVNQVQRRGNSSHAVTICNNGLGSTIQNTQFAPTEVVVASSTSGEVKLSLKCNFDTSSINLAEVLKMLQDKCLHSYKVLPSDISIRKILNEVCQSVAELGSVHSEDDGNGGSLHKEAVDGNGNASVPVPVPESSEPIFENWVVACQPGLALSNQKPIHDVADICKGEERVRISIVDEFGNGSYPPSFHYTSKSLVFESAYVHISIARISDEDCCADCSGNCLSASLPCACARSTGGEFAYTPEGLLRATFLDECMAVSHFPEKHRKLCSEACPLERSKNQASPDPCKGHLVRKFIKECWSKCGCGMQCGNRVLQRGITCNMQVFLTREGKGWGLRTVEELPKGAFVCEYVGEILTSIELHERAVGNAENSNYMHQVVLDANWASKGVVLRDEEALFLDATFYGNVGRFVSHRCNDANLVLIPVEVETPDRNYYHLGFFTNKKIEAFEELTWDYGIQFDGADFPNKAFRCMCGSKYCRDPKNSRRKGRPATRRN